MTETELLDRITRDNGRILMRFPGPEPVMRHDDIADEYLIASMPEADSGLIVFYRFGEKWEANPYNNRPVIRVLLNFLFQSKEQS